MLELSLFAGGASAFAETAPALASPLTAEDRATPQQQRDVSTPGVTLSERPFAALWQVKAWPGGMAAVETAIAASVGATAPGPGFSAGDPAGALALRTAPLAWWIVGEGPVARPDLGGAGTLLDLSHARWRLRLEGTARDAVLSRLISLDLRPGRFGPGRVALAPIQHLGCVFHVGEDGGAGPAPVDIYAPRSQARALWKLVRDTAIPFGCQIGP
ncbi:MAG: hypothetical protein AAFS07_16540 [Pseudomonadota bacterium]